MTLARGKFLGCTWKKWFDESDVPPGFAGLFNQVTPENAGKWERAQPERNRFEWAALDAMHAFAGGRGILVKGHTFVWGQQQPKWTDSLKTEGETKAALEAWIQAYFKRYGSSVQMVDVVNEPLHHVPAYARWLGGSGSTGWGWVIWTFETARKHAPQGCKLLLNDYDLLKSSPNADKMVALAVLLKKRGLIDGIGAQSHFLEGIRASTARP